MIFPSTYSVVLLVAVLSLVLGAAWALTQRAAGKWRFELFGLDFGLGVVAGALLIGFTLGTLGSEITFYDNLLIMRKSSLLFLFGFGALINLGMLLTMGAISLAGMGVAFLSGMSIATIVAAIGTQMVAPIMTAPYLIAGTLLLLLGTALAARAHSIRVQQRETDLLQKAALAGIKGKIQRTSAAKAVLLAVIGGVLIGLAQPIGTWAQSRDEIGFGAYSIGAIYASAFLVAAPFFSLFFLNLPVQGEALSFSAWMNGTARQHLLGMAGGVLWIAGLTALLLAGSAPASLVGSGRTVLFALSRGFVVAGAAIGIFLNGEFSTSPPARTQAVIGLGLAAAGLLVYALSPA
jgi:glucose uptake protein